jgi:hypothetical protein
MFNFFKLIINKNAFLRLSDTERYDTEWSLSVHVDRHSKDKIAINIYTINNFYCQVHYYMKTNKILYTQNFKQGDRLYIYLARI